MDNSPVGIEHDCRVLYRREDEREVVGVFGATARVRDRGGHAGGNAGMWRMAETHGQTSGWQPGTKNRAR